MIHGQTHVPAGHPRDAAPNAAVEVRSPARGHWLGSQPELVD